MVKQVEVKNYRIRLQKKPLSLKQMYEIDVRATSEEQALETAFSTLGSKQRLKRGMAIVREIKEISADELKNSILREIASDDKVIIRTE